ncbi:MAG: membrane-targeted effector domain-containing toxin, partial [Paludibacterium sp.]|nr:membrane-targeted effector domain-containing toxin [Paludibacterium sp.]
RPAPPEIALAAPISDQLGQLLARYPGIVVGEVHAEHWGKQLLTEQMASLRDQGVRTLYLEQLITEQHQALLDKWHAAPDNAIPERLRSGLEAVDPEHQVGQDYTFIALVKAAHRHGVAVVPLDCFGAFYTHVLFNELQRIKLMNYYAMLRIRERQAAAPTDKWIALVGNAHANHFGSVPGIVELTGAVGLRVAGEPAGLLPDTGTWASSIELGQGFLKSDFVVSHRPVLTDGEINARLRAPGDFAIVYAPEPNRMAYELRYRDARRITVLPIRLTPNGLHFYLADTPWPAINHFQVLSLKTLNKMLEQIAKLHNVWPRLTPQPITTLSPEQRDLALHPAEAARQWQAAFEGLRQATLLRQLFFAPAQDQGEFKAGKAAWQAELAATPRFVEADLDTLKHIFVQQAPTATPRRLGALLAAVADRQARQADELAETWRAQIARLGGTAIRPLGHNRYLSATNHRQGVCAGLCAHMAAAWLQDAAAPGHAYLDAYLDNVEAATHAPDSDSARLLDLSLLAWSFGVPEAKFGTTSVASSAPLAGVIDQLERAGIPAVFKLSFGNHAMLLAKGGPATTRTFLLADPNFGYCKLSDRQALTNALDWHGQLVRRLLLPDETGDRIFTLRRYRADLPKQKLFPQVETGWLATQKLADLCALPARTAQFTTPLTQDATYRQLAWRLTLLEYRQTLQGLDPLNTTSRMLSDLLTRHQAPQSAVRAHARVLKIVFRRPNALITLAAPAGQVYPPLLIDGARYPQDIALLQKLVSLQQDLAPRGTLSFLSRWLRPRQAPVREIDRDVLSASLPDDAIERFLISSPARPF